MGRLFLEPRIRGGVVYLTSLCQTNSVIQVYLLDQTERGRSAWQQSVDGAQSTVNALIIEQRFTATEQFNIWPQASLHTQWPGNGTRGDPIFDNFYRSTVPSLVDQVETSNKVRAAAAALLDKIGVRTI